MKFSGEWGVAQEPVVYSLVAIRITIEIQEFCKTERNYFLSRFLQSEWVTPYSLTVSE